MVRQLIQNNYQYFYPNICYFCCVGVHKFKTFFLTDKKLNVTIQGDADVAKAIEVSSADMGKQLKLCLKSLVEYQF